MSIYKEFLVKNATNSSGAASTVVPGKESASQNIKLAHESRGIGPATIYSDDYNDVHDTVRDMFNATSEEDNRSGLNENELSDGTFDDYHDGTDPISNLGQVILVVELPLSAAENKEHSRHGMVTQSRSGPNYTHTSLVAAASPSLLEPASLSEALATPHWVTAMHEELRALNANDTWILVPRERGMHAIRSKWVFKARLNPDGSIERFKARLVAKGYNQVEGVNISETFSPVIRHSTVKLVLSLAVVQKWHIKKLDVKNAFLHGVLSEIVFMEKPPGFRNSSS